jgi:class III cytochrome C family protein
MMQLERVRTKQKVVLATIAILFFFASGGYGATGPTSPSGPERADVILIDAMTVFDSLERPPVEFLHDKHSQAVEKLGKDCSVCHLKEKEKDRLSIKYMRLEDTKKETVMNLYHENCIACHNEQLSAGKESGPLVCAGCHGEALKTASNWQAIGMDSSLHYRHVKATKQKCETCHHEYDETAKKLIYTKGKEGTCRYCHRAQTEENRVAMRWASHMACVDCHVKTTQKNQTAGPIQCAGCHEPSQQKMIEVVKDVPRMEMKQPNAVFVSTGAKKVGTAAPIMKQVPFDHKAHETYNNTCRGCHHASLTSCSECHTQDGKKDGNWIKLEQAMHGTKAEASCIGCHAKTKGAKECAGCHSFMTAIKQPPQSFCASCHQAPVPEDGMMTPEQASAAAEAKLGARTPVTSTYDVQDIPEKVTIKALSKDYEPVELPHRKIVLKLVENAKSSPLAKYFHAEVGTLCQGCHHNSPAAKKPPLCGSCHGKPFNESNLFRPGLMAAYHQQCMGCHDQMGIEKPANRDCKGCHKEKE